MKSNVLTYTKYLWTWERALCQRLPKCGFCSMPMPVQTVSSHLFLREAAGGHRMPTLSWEVGARVHTWVMS